jgi:hypothetical protein
MTIFDIAFVCVAISLSIYFITHAKVEININHHQDPITYTPVEQPELKPNELPPSFDDVLKQVNEIIYGGTDNAE